MIAESLVRKQRFVKLNDRPLQPRQGFPELFVVGSVVGGGPRRNSGDGRTSVTRITRIGRLIVDGSAQRRYRLERTCLNTIRVNMEQTLFVVKTNPDYTNNQVMGALIPLESAHPHNFHTHQLTQTNTQHSALKHPSHQNQTPLWSTISATSLTTPTQPLKHQEQDSRSRPIHTHPKLVAS